MRARSSKYIERALILLAIEVFLAWFAFSKYSALLQQGEVSSPLQLPPDQMLVFLGGLALSITLVALIFYNLFLYFSAKKSGNPPDSSP